MITLESNWQEVKSKVILPLWNNKFKTMYVNAKMDYDDFESLAGYELSKAIPKFDPEKSNMLTFATRVISKKAITELRNCTQRDKRKALHLAESVDGLDRSIVENLFCDNTDFESPKDVLSEKMNKYLSRLSKLQKEILFAMSEGYTNEEIVVRLKITAKEMSEACAAIKSYRNVSILF